MAQQHDLKLDPYGNIDVDYYVQQAKAQRRVYMAELNAAVKAKFKTLFRAKHRKVASSH
ncbi:RSP_7527 family protein [Gallaecimonas pentaromativorans]|uniref:RSP_7527 family protein n=1 Tax=Gallaecimonas pentaromativorans TaxID=584787 RepID=UPI0012ECE6E8|nr:hypothetical protein [Gallaecimonas pentaromativorans]MED5525238.1 hypothetical protein [Pseudomonadota bacterium]